MEFAPIGGGPSTRYRSRTLRRGKAILEDRGIDRARAFFAIISGREVQTSQEAQHRSGVADPTLTRLGTARAGIGRGLGIAEVNPVSFRGRWQFPNDHGPTSFCGARTRQMVRAGASSAGGDGPSGVASFSRKTGWKFRAYAHKAAPTQARAVDNWVRRDRARSRRARGPAGTTGRRRGRAMLRDFHGGRTGRRRGRPSTLAGKRAPSSDGDRPLWRQRY